MKSPRRLLLGSMLIASAGLSRIAWEDLTEGDWIYSLATRFASVEGHRVHYPTPPKELAGLLEGHKEAAALRYLAESRLSLGDRPGALSAMEKWAQAHGAEAWGETARWASSHSDMPAAFRAAERALPGLPEAQKAALSLERIA